MIREDLPNLLTLARIALIAPLAALFFVPASWASWGILAVFALASATDYLDGVLARRMASESKLGRLLDPIADKLLVIATLFMLAGSGRLAGLLLIPALAIVLREVFVSGLREFLSGRVALPVTMLAKWKTAVQMAAIGLLVVADQPGWGAAAGAAGGAGLWLAAALTLITGWQYLSRSLPHIKDGPRQPRPPGSGPAADGYQP